VQGLFGTGCSEKLSQLESAGQGALLSDEWSTNAIGYRRKDFFFSGGQRELRKSRRNMDAHLMLVLKKRPLMCCHV